MMIKANTTKNWIEVPKNLMTTFSVENSKKLNNDSIYRNQTFAWEDMRGLSWIFVNDEVI